ncbi:MAG: competence protein ComK [Faecalicoccus sp.]|nr:competence protein ComK [Faecalicoccus sp.]
MNYCYYDYSKSTVCKVKEDQKEYIPSRSMNSFLNHECLKHGSTLQGRIDFFRKRMKIKKYTPILISENPITIVFPIESNTSSSNIWISYFSIKQVQYNEKTCTLHFHDGTCLTTNHPNRIKNILRIIQMFLLTAA